MKRIIAAILSVMMIVALSACGGSTTDGGSATKAASGDQGGQTSSSKAITAAIEAVPDSLDPDATDLNTTLTVCRHIYDKLVEFDMEYNWIPGVASSWEQVDETHWTFEINTEFKFQNGEALEMEDVVYSVERLKDIPQTADASACVKSVSADGTTLTIELEEADNVSMAKLMSLCYVVNKSYLEETGDTGRYTEVCGTGPYKVSSFTPGSSITLETWDEYPFEQPDITSITFNAIAEQSSIYIAVETGSAQYGGFVTGNELATAETNDKLYGISVASNIIRQFEFNCTEAPFDNVNVRRAIAYCIDRDSWCMLDGGHDKSESMIANGFKDYYVSENLPEFDLDKAKELLEEEGYNESNPLEFELLVYRDDSGYELTQAYLKEIGVNMTITQLEFTNWLEHESTLDFQVCFSGLDTPSGSQIEDLARFDIDYLGSRNNTGYSNPELDEITKTIRTSQDEDEISELMKKASDIVAQDCPNIPVYCDTLMAVAVNGLQGVEIRSDMVVNFRNATFE